MMNRGILTILIHPRTRYEVEDHFGRAMWLGLPYRINLDGGIVPDSGEQEPAEYPNLQLGYNYNPNSPYAPNNWLKR